MEPATIDEPPKYRIVSDGTPRGTTVMLAETGKIIGWVSSVTWHCDVKIPHAEITLKILAKNVEIDVIGEVKD